MRISNHSWDDNYQILWNILQSYNQATKSML